jgi:hypothetical protein
MKKTESAFRNMFKDLLPEEQIDSIITQKNDLKGWTPVTLRELQAMSEEERKKLLSYCWHDGRVRCSCIGITNLEVTPYSNSYDIKWSDIDGDPHTRVSTLDEPMHNIGDGEWNYGLYRK